MITKSFKFDNQEKELSIIETWQNVYLVADEVAEVFGITFDALKALFDSSRDIDGDDVVWRQVYYNGKLQYITLISHICLDIICSKINTLKSKKLHEFFHKIYCARCVMKKEHIQEFKRCYMKIQAYAWSMIDGKPFINCWCDEHNM
jgi:hypothetical protein